MRHLKAKLVIKGRDLSIKEKDTDALLRAILLFRSWALCKDHKGWMDLTGTYSHHGLCTTLIFHREGATTKINPLPPTISFKGQLQRRTVRKATSHGYICLGKPYLSKHWIKSHCGCNILVWLRLFLEGLNPQWYHPQSKLRCAGHHQLLEIGDIRTHGTLD